MLLSSLAVSRRLSSNNHNKQRLSSRFWPVSPAGQQLPAQGARLRPIATNIRRNSANCILPPPPYMRGRAGLFGNVIDQETRIDSAGDMLAKASMFLAAAAMPLRWLF